MWQLLRLRCSSAAGASGVVKEGHESEIHMKLLMTVKQGLARVVSNEIKLDFLIPAEHHDVLHDASRRFARDPVDSKL